MSVFWGKGQELSKEHKDLSYFATYFSGILSPIFAFLAFIGLIITIRESRIAHNTDIKNKKVEFIFSLLQKLVEEQSKSYMVKGDEHSFQTIIREEKSRDLIESDLFRTEYTTDLLRFSNTLIWSAHAIISYKKMWGLDLESLYFRTSIAFELTKMKKALQSASSFYEGVNKDFAGNLNQILRQLESVDKELIK